MTASRSAQWPERRTDATVRAMQNRSRLPLALRGAAVAVLLAGLGTWVATGAHRGWTQTSAVTMQKDEITGIDYPVRRDAFVAGVEIPLAAAGLAAVLAGLSFVSRRRPVAGLTPAAQS